MLTRTTRAHRIRQQSRAWHPVMCRLPGLHLWPHALPPVRPGLTEAVVGQARNKDSMSKVSLSADIVLSQTQAVRPCFSSTGSWSEVARGTAGRSSDDNTQAPEWCGLKVRTYPLLLLAGRLWKISEASLNLSFFYEMKRVTSTLLGVRIHGEGPSVLSAFDKW